MSEFDAARGKESPIHGTQPQSWRDRPYDSAAGRAGAARFMLGICMVWLLVLIWSDWLELSLLKSIKDGALISEAAAKNNDNRQLLVAGAFAVSC